MNALARRHRREASLVERNRYASRPTWERAPGLRLVLLLVMVGVLAFLPAWLGALLSVPLD
jgi:hypothetical protein